MSLFKQNEYVRDVRMGNSPVRDIYLGSNKVWTCGMYYARYVPKQQDLYVFTNYVQTTSEGSLLRDINMQPVSVSSSFPKHSPTKVGEYYFTEIKWDPVKGLQCINATTKTTTYVFSGEVALAYINNNQYYVLKTISVNTCQYLEIENTNSRGIIHLKDYANKVCFSTESNLTTFPSGLIPYGMSTLPAYYNKYFRSYVNFFDENNLKVWNGSSVVTYTGGSIAQLYAYKYNIITGELTRLSRGDGNYWGTEVRGYGGY